MNGSSPTGLGRESEWMERTLMAELFRFVGTHHIHRSQEVLLRSRMMACPSGLKHASINSKMGRNDRHRILCVHACYSGHRLQLKRSHRKLKGSTGSMLCLQSIELSDMVLLPLRMGVFASLA